MVGQKFQSYGTLKSWYVKRIPEEPPRPPCASPGDLLPRWAEGDHFLDLYIDMLDTFQEASEEGFGQPARKAQEAVM